jgi:hypothetical protein
MALPDAGQRHLRELPRPEQFHGIHQRLRSGFHIGLNAIIFIKVKSVFGMGSGIADIGSDVRLVARCDHAHIFQPIGEHAAEVFHSCRIAMNGNCESATCEAARIVLAFQFSSFAFAGSLPPVVVGSVFPPSAQTNRSIMAFRPVGA